VNCYNIEMLYLLPEYHSTGSIVLCTVPGPVAAVFVIF
jgi:hypothetical protein